MPPCPVCAATRSRPFGVKNGCTLARCLACGAIHADPAGAPPDLYTAYHDAARFELVPTIAATLRDIVRSLEPYRRGGRWLDVGFGEGALLEQATALGWTCHGTEVSPQALARGREQGWAVTDEPVHDPRFGEATFDVVTLIEVIEHVPEPGRFLRDALQWLRPGGAIYLTTPNAESLNRYILGSAWSVFCPPEHLTLWTRRGLGQALEKLGFEGVTIKTHGLNPAEIRARWLTRRRNAAEVNRHQEGLALSVSLSRTSARRAAKRAANVLLDLLGTGDTLKAWARKPVA